MGLVAETHGDSFQFSTPLHVNLLMRIDENITDTWILKQWLERTQSRQFVEDFLGEVLQLFRVKKDSFRFHVIRDELAYLPAKVFAGHLLQRCQIQIVDQLAMQADLCLEKRLSEQLTFPGLSLYAGGTLIGIGVLLHNRFHGSRLLRLAGAS